jgi:hypothetical protein
MQNQTTTRIDLNVLVCIKNQTNGLTSIIIEATMRQVERPSATESLTCFLNLVAGVHGGACCI